MTVAVLFALPSLVLTPVLWVEWMPRVSTEYAGTTYGMSTIPAIPRLLVCGDASVSGLLLEPARPAKNWPWVVRACRDLVMPGLKLEALSFLLAILPLYGLGLRGDWHRTLGRLTGHAVRPGTIAQTASPRSTGGQSRFCTRCSPTSTRDRAVSRSRR